jgi:hypothetical protein
MGEAAAFSREAIVFAASVTLRMSDDSLTGWAIPEQHRHAAVVPYIEFRQRIVGNASDQTQSVGCTRYACSFVIALPNWYVVADIYEIAIEFIWPMVRDLYIDIVCGEFAWKAFGGPVRIDWPEWIATCARTNECDFVVVNMVIGERVALAEIKWMNEA